MDTLLLEPREIAREAAPDIDAPHVEHQDIEILEPREAELGVADAWLLRATTAEAFPVGSPANATPTYLHPAVVIAASGGYAWFLLAFWVGFFGYGEMTYIMDIATLISGTMLGLMIGGVVAGRNVIPWQRPWHSFREFLDGEVEVWGGHVSGRDAFVQLAGMAWLLAGLATAFAVIVMAVRTT